AAARGLPKSVTPTPTPPGPRLTHSPYTTLTRPPVSLPGPFTISDDRQGSFPCGSGPLAPGATTSCTSTHMATAADVTAGQLTNTATATTALDGVTEIGRPSCRQRPTAALGPANSPN